MTDRSAAAEPQSGAASRLLPQLLKLLLSPTDGAWLAVFRMLFGLTMSVSMLRFIVYGWIDLFFVKPTFHFKYWGFSWVEPLSASGMHALFAVLCLLALCITLGLFFRLAAWGFALGFAYLQLIDVATYLNHYYLAALLAVLLALSPAHRLWSLDAWRMRRLRQSTVPRLWLYLFRFQVGVVYTFAGLAKAQSDWLFHAEPLSIWLSSKSGMPVIGRLITEPWIAPAMSWAGFLFDSTIVIWLSIQKTRPFAYIAVIAFHVLTRMLFPIGMFPVIMVLGALVFFSPEWPRRPLAVLAKLPLVNKLLELTKPAGAAARSANEATAGVTPASPGSFSLLRLRHKLAGAALFAYLIWSLVVPLRQVLYNGSVLWHEQGMRWSWRVMVREKNGSVTFIVRDAENGNEWQVAPRRYLTRLQEREMSGQPDLILQLAHHIHDEYRAKLGRDVEVRVDALVSLNGRRIRPLIDPNVDLAKVQDGILPARWITQAPSEAPPRIRAI